MQDRVVVEVVRHWFFVVLAVHSLTTSATTDILSFPSFSILNGVAIRGFRLVHHNTARSLKLADVLS